MLIRQAEASSLADSPAPPSLLPVHHHQVNLLIKQAEASSLAEDEAIGGRVVLEGDNWQDAARCGGGGGSFVGRKKGMRVACLFWKTVFCRSAVSVVRALPLLWTDSGGRGIGDGVYTYTINLRPALVMHPPPLMSERSACFFQQGYRLHARGKGRL